MSGLAGLGLEGGGAVTLRLSRRLDDGVQTLGWLEVWVGGAVVFGCATLELPWRGNARRVSCIPPGPGAGDVTYRVALRTSARFGAHLDVIGEEPARSLVLIHAGNSFRDTAGCILVGDAVRDVNGDGVLDVANSRATLARLRAWVPPAGCPLVISGVGERPSSRLRAEARAVARRDVAADGVGGLRARPPARLGRGAAPVRMSKPARASMTIRNAAVSAASWAAVVVAAVLARLGWDVPADEVSAVLVGLVGLWTSVRAIVGRVRTRTRIEGLLVLAAVLACGSAEAQSARVPGGVVPCYANVWTTDHGAGTLAGKLADVEALAGRAVRHGAGGGAYTGGGLRGAAHVAAALRARGLTAVLNVNAPWRIEETLSASAVERGGAAWGVFLRDHADVYASA
ncbi:MAG: DUF5675 family protein, partial [Rubricoccaceae bacterium]|nr:DUF5675 family protein [Rubricoccaceae bacterium]